MASNSIARASLQLTADSGELTAGLGEAKSKISSWADSIGQQFSKVGSGGKAAIVSAFAGLSFGSVMSAFDDVSKSIKAVAKQAREVGASVEAMSALGYAARVAGVSTEDLQGALEALNANLKRSDADNLFSQLGLDVAKLRALPLDQAMERIADSLKSIEDPSEKARLSLAIFGDKAIALDKLLKGGGAGIKELTSEAKRLGLVINDVDASKIKEATEALARMKARAGAAMDGLKQSAVIAFAPVVDVVATAITNIRAKIQEMVADWKDGSDNAIEAIRGIAVAVGYIWDALRVGLGAWTEYVNAPSLRALAVVTDVVSNIVEAHMGFVDTLRDTVMPAIGEAWDSVKPYVSAVAEVWSEGWDEIFAAIGSVTDSITGALTDALEALGIDWRGILDDITAAINALIAKLKVLTDAVRDAFALITKRSKAGDAVRGVADVVGDIGHTIGDTQLGDAASAINKFFDGLRTKAKDTETAVGKVNPIDKVRTGILQSINELESELRKSMQTIGMDSGQAKIIELQLKGATPAELARVKELAEQSKNVGIAFGTIKMPPLETFERTLEGLDTMLQSGRLTWQQYQLGVADSAKALMDAAGISGEIKAPQGLLKGSSAAVSAEIKAELQGMRNDPAAEMRRAQMELKEIQKAQLEVAKAMLKELSKANEDEFELLVA